MIYKECEYKPKIGKYYFSFCKDNLGKKYPQWIVPCRILNISPAEYVRLLMESYNAIITYFPKTGFIVRYWEKQTDESRWRNFINKVAREKGFHI